MDNHDGSSDGGVDANGTQTFTIYFVTPTVDYVTPTTPANNLPLTNGMSVISSGPTTIGNTDTLQILRFLIRGQPLGRLHRRSREPRHSDCPMRPRNRVAQSVGGN